MSTLEVMMTATITVRAGSRTDTGRVRTHNEDSIITGQNVWAVADGMGGQASGEIASSIVAQQLTAADARGIDDAQFLATVLSRTNDEILSYGQSHPRSRGLGSTVAGLASISIGDIPHWLIFHIGDSRVYRFSDGTLSQITNDHSEVAELVASGKITFDQARHHPNRNILTRCLGSYPPPAADMRILPSSPPEQFLICSDGLTTEVADAEISKVLLTSTGPDETADRLVQLALGEGGRDNVSVVIVASDDVHDDDVSCGILEDTIPRI